MANSRVWRGFSFMLPTPLITARFKIFIFVDNRLYMLLLPRPSLERESNTAAIARLSLYFDARQHMMIDGRVAQLPSGRNADATMLR